MRACGVSLGHARFRLPRPGLLRNVDGLDFAREPFRVSATLSPPIESVCLVLPAYNEGAVIAPLIERAVVALPQVAPVWSIVVVDDGSRDDTAEKVRVAARAHPQVRLVQHPQNRGLGPAIVTCLQSGLEQAPDPARLATHMIVGMDADLTHPPETIPDMRRMMDAGADLVIASRFQPESVQRGVPPLRLLMSVGARLVFRLYLNLPGVRDYTCGFRAFRASLVRASFDRFGDGLITRSGFACTDELLVHMAMLDPVIREAPFELRYDFKQGRSKMNLGLTIVETIKMLHHHRRLIKTRNRP
jgi:dolichol-phosphate mannosyltransferase